MSGRHQAPWTLGRQLMEVAAPARRVPGRHVLSPTDAATPGAVSQAATSPEGGSSGSAGSLRPVDPAGGVS